SNQDSLFLGAYSQATLDSTFIYFSFPNESIDTFSFKPNYVPKKGNWRRVNSSFYWKGNCDFNRGEAPIILTVTATDNGCLQPNTLSKTFYLKTSQSPKIAGPTQVCAGDNSVRFSLPESLAGNSYTWLLPDWIKGQSTSNSIIVNFEPNTYRIGTIQVTGNNGCNQITSSSHSVMATNKPDPPIINFTGLNIHSNVPIGNYWFKNGLLLMGEVKDYLTVRDNGFYTCILNYYGCKSDPSNEIIHSVSLDEKFNQNEWSVFPNPFSSELHVSLPTNWSSAEYVLTNSLGQTLQSGQLSPNQSISTGFLISGMYNLQIKSSKGLLQRKLIKL
ncbi:MAG: T9SS type A sorting domain-containing protein, partial [Bacteroidia bacterium]|nr:T9SS type A sorting domain-containing protein [Bacteroidia bacterium]